MEEFYPRCEKCGGKVIRVGLDRKCLQCGQEWKSNQEKGEFYEFHRDEILADLRRLGAAAAGAKWQASPGTLSSLVKRWGMPEPSVSPAPQGGDSTGGFPNLPAWRDDWAPEVQLQWLHVYEMVINYTLERSKP